MKPTRLSDIRLLQTLIVVIGLGILFLVLTSIEGRKREDGITAVALVRSQQMMRVRIDAMMMELAEDLRAEALALREWDRVSDEGLIIRWRPLLASHGSIMSIAVADAAGNECTMVRQGTVLRFRKVEEAARNTPAIWHVVDDPDTLAPGMPPPERALDPRTRLWFSKALEDPGEEPVWHLASEASDNEERLKLSNLVRDVDGNAPFLVIAIEVDITRSRWLDALTTPMSQYGYMLMDGKGRILNLPDAGKASSILDAEVAAADRWRAQQTRDRFSVESSGRRFNVLIAPYHLKGETLYTGTLMDHATVEVWTRAQRHTLVAMTLILVSLGVLASLLWLGRRRERETLRRKERHSRTQERRLAKALGEREVLNREVHHRVKNNLQVVSSLLNLQASRLEDSEVREEFLRGKRRIDAMALVHHKLYGLKDLRSVDLNRFIRDLVEALAHLHGANSGTISHEVRTGGVQSDQDTAINLGIILCELVGNAYQHAFPYATGGHIEIDVQQVEGELHRLLVQDNGKGLPADHTDGPGKLGLEIVEALAEQLDGSFHQRSSGGTIFEVLFRIPSDPPPEPEDH